ncbi:ATP-binding protein [Nannocystis sp.]|uniref:GAF domain-containing sensor histidine kinase n=1 Tax=Nannocystis sp. TaxID=1962667 RepID=UPI0025E89C6A|nr:ATP-binding protein [Nannocystis sp.]
MHAPDESRPLVLCSRSFAESPLAAAGAGLPGELRALDRAELERALSNRRGRPLVVLLDEALQGTELRVAPGHTLRVLALLPAPAAANLRERLGDALSFILPPDGDPQALAVALRCAVREAAAADRCFALEHERRRLAGEITKLNRIGIALSAERDPERLLNFILTTARDFTSSDAGSLYILERDDEGQGRLRFTSSQNDSLPDLELVKFAIPVSKSTLAGYVAATGEPLNIPNVYELDPRAEFSFSPAFDQRTGYRTRSMLVLPMKNQEDRVIGVLQLINRKTSRAAELRAGNIDEVVIPYDDQSLELTLSLASQAAVSLTNNQLYDTVKEQLHELKTSQAQLVQSEKLASLGQLTAGVAHEINNPLAFSRNNTHLAHARVTSVSRRLAATNWLARVDGPQSERIAAGRTTLEKLAQDKALAADVKDVSNELGSLPPPRQLDMLRDFFTYVLRRKEADEGSIEELLARTQKVLEESFIGLDRMAEIVLGLRNFARLDEAQFQTADIDEGIRQTLMILGNNARDKGVTLVSELRLARPHSCFPAKLNQVVLNLVNNAIDACQRGGEVAVRTRENEGFVEITVSDNGEGISEANMSKIFDPFFTTKPVGKGTGLGLSISYRIIMEHRGTISVRRNDPTGVTFLIRFPVDAEAPKTTSVGST